MRYPATLIVMALAATFASSPAAMAQAGAGANNTLYNRLNANTGAGGPAPKHDLSGAWTGPIQATPGEVPPLTPLGMQRRSLNKSEHEFGTAHSNDPMNTCDPLGIPRNLIWETRGVAFSTMRDRIVLLHQYQRIWRDIWMDGRELPKNIDAKGGPESRWYGYSVGHWDGDNTLVIDTVGSDDRSWLDNAGDPHSSSAHVQERYTRVDHNHLELTVTVDDPKMYTKPFVLGTSKFIWIPTQETDEQLCVPSEAITYFNSISRPAFGEVTKEK